MKLRLAKTNYLALNSFAVLFAFISLRSSTIKNMFKRGEPQRKIQPQRGAENISYQKSKILTKKNTFFVGYKNFHIFTS